jgi:hypothetical protein
VVLFVVFVDDLRGHFIHAGIFFQFWTQKFFKQIIYNNAVFVLMLLFYHEKKSTLKVGSSMLEAFRME